MEKFRLTRTVHLVAFLWVCANHFHTTIILAQSKQFALSSKWEQISNFGGDAVSGSSSFSIGSNAFVVTGMNQNSNFTSDVWQFDSSTNLWTKKNNFTGPQRIDGIGFSIGQKGYVGFGIGSTDLLRDMNEYNSQTDSWIQKTNFPGSARYLPTVFVIGQKAFIVGGCSASGQLKDVWEYNSQTNTWTKKNDFPGTARNSAVGFSFGNKGYISTGVISGNPFVLVRDFWEYNPETDQWVMKADFPGVARGYAKGFCLGNKIYMGGGSSFISSTSSPITETDFWEYDILTNTWSRVPDFPGVGRAMSVSFVIGSYGYFGLGGDASGNLLKDFWKFSPENSTGGIQNGEHDIPISVELFPNYPNPFNPTTTIKFSNTMNQKIRVDVFDSLGNELKHLLDEEVAVGDHAIIWDGKDKNGKTLPSGVYFFSLSNGKYHQVQKGILLK